MDAPPKPVWTADDIKVEDLAKLPFGPRELMMLEFSPEELIRLTYLENIPASIREVLNSPGFWVKKLKSNDFILPDNILDFAEKWRKKHKTAAQFLMSLYDGIDLRIFESSLKIKNKLESISEMLKKRTEFDELTAKVQELSGLAHAKTEELKLLNNTLIALDLSHTTYVFRKDQGIMPFNFGFLARDFVFVDGSWEEFSKMILEHAIGVEDIKDHLVDPFDLFNNLVKKYNEDHNKKKKEIKKQIKRENQIKPIKSTSPDDPEEDSDEEGKERKKRYPKEKAKLTIQMPEGLIAKELLREHLEMVRHLIREGDIVNGGHYNQKYYAYFIDGQLQLKLYGDALPEEAFAFLKQKNLRSAKQARNRYRVHQIDLEGHLVTLSDSPNRILHYDGHTFQVENENERRPPRKQAADQRCRWLTKVDNKQRRCGNNCTKNNYFCTTHRMMENPEHQEQEERCREEDGDIIKVAEEVSLDVFPVIGKKVTKMNAQQASKKYRSDEESEEDCDEDCDD